jgi:putative PIN family toxin of toxin-antitoxin system
MKMYSRHFVRIVLDINVLIAAFATRGLCEDVLRTVLAEHELVVSEFILGELERVLREKLKMPSPRVRAVTDFIRRTSLVVEPTDPSNWPENDPDDQWIVATAMIGDAQLLVSGDRDLLNASQKFQLRSLALASSGNDSSSWRVLHCMSNGRVSMLFN